MDKAILMVYSKTNEVWTNPVMAICQGALEEQWTLKKIWQGVSTFLDTIAKQTELCFKMKAKHFLMILEIFIWCRISTGDS